ncbi:SLAM family member 5-like [Hemiscyllium ocellatum]|uniref:SLAM family member 5-like n=1 Tax=Hemiscyllium ocellatum TaxID=170820 RepID=UPI002966116B|nr:SLAM family member 5-like [Hemiscyllium ocellatum]
MFLLYTHFFKEQCIWLTLFLFIKYPGLVQTDGNLGSSHLLNGSLGQSFALPARIPWPDPLILTWDFRSSSTGRKIQICNKARNHPAECSNDFRERFRLNLTDYSLEIETLKKSDQGWYEVNARLGQEIHVELMELRVYERVSHPAIQWTTNVSIEGICNVTLKCSVENDGDLLYGWRREEMVTNVKSQSVTNNGRTLSVSLTLQNTSTVYSCIVKNPVSEETESVDLIVACNGREKGDATLNSIHILGIRMVIFIVAVIISVAITGFCVWHRITVKGN